MLGYGIFPGLGSWWVLFTSSCYNIGRVRSNFVGLCPKLFSGPMVSAFGIGLRLRSLILVNQCLRSSSHAQGFGPLNSGSTPLDKRLSAVCRASVALLTTVNTAENEMRVASGGF